MYGFVNLDTLARIVFVREMLFSAVARAGLWVSGTLLGFFSGWVQYGQV